MKVSAEFKEYKKGRLDSMTKRILKRIIGIIYLIIVGGIYLVFSEGIQYRLPRLIACINWALFGITCRALIYYQLKITGEDVVLKENEGVGTIVNYFFYGLTAWAVVSIIYLTFYDTLEKIDFIYFNLIVIPLFLYVGFAITEVKKRFLGGD